jgi:uroporphyrinogen decarboxylase
MTDLDIFRQTVAHEQGDRFLYYFGLTSSLRTRLAAELEVDDNVDIPGRYGCYRPVAVDPRLAPLGDPDSDIDFGAYFEGIEQPEGSYYDANGVLHLPGSMYHFTRYISPLRNATSLSEIEAFPIPAVVPGSDAGMTAAVDAAHAKGKVAFSHCFHIYENSWQVRGYEQFLMDMMQEPDFCDSILERFFERNHAIAMAAARAGADFVRTGDDVANQNGMMFPPDLWWKFIGRRWALIYEDAKRIHPGLKIWYHSDGNIEAILDKLIEIGVDIINPVQPECVDVARVFKRYGRSLVIDGGVGTQTVMPFGTPFDVRSAVENLKSLKRRNTGNALIVSPTHVLEPEVPTENIVAMVDAAAG